MLSGSTVDATRRCGQFGTDPSIHPRPIAENAVAAARRGQHGSGRVRRPGSTAHFNIADHVILAPADRPLTDENDFLAWCARRSVIPLDRTRPLWRLDIVPGLPSRQVGLLLVLHHVVADGLRGVHSSRHYSSRHLGSSQKVQKVLRGGRDRLLRAWTSSETICRDGGMPFAIFTRHGSSDRRIRCVLSPMRRDGARLQPHSPVRSVTGGT